MYQKFVFYYAVKLGSSNFQVIFIALLKALSVVVKTLTKKKLTKKFYKLYVLFSEKYNKFNYKKILFNIKLIGYIY